MTSDTAFDRALAFVLAHEGGDVDDPRDPGGRTRFGISRRRYPAEDLDALTRERAASLYRRDFWDALGLGGLPPDLAVAAFDAAVNAGLGRAARWLQEGLNQALPAGDALAVDGRIGPQTAAAAWRVAGLGPTHLELARVKMLMARLELYARLAARPPLDAFLRGWLNRTLDLNAAACAAQETHV